MSSVAGPPHDFSQGPIDLGGFLSTVDADAATPVFDLFGTDLPFPDLAHPFDLATHDAGTTAVTRVGLVGEWLFSGNLNDTSGNNNTCIPNNAPAPTTDRYGKASSAISFNGSTQFLTIPDSLLMPMDGNFTFSAWINATTFVPLAGIASKCFSSDCATFTFRLGDQYPYAYIDLDSATEYVAQKTALVAGTWEHVAGTMMNGVATIYVNGVQTFTNSQGYTVQGQSQGIRLGVDYQHSFWNGSIDDVRIYSRVLTAAEIATLAAEK